MEASENDHRKLLQQAYNEVEHVRRSFQCENDALLRRLSDMEASENDLRELLQQACNEVDDARKSLQSEKDTLCRRVIDLEANETDLRELLQEARKRLSEMMSIGLTDNNPNIADLSDKYRPMKLAELMSELYDNQWTEAFNYFADKWQGEFSERACVDFLLRVIMEVYTFCSRKVSVEWTAMMNSLSLSAEEDKELLKLLKDNRKTKALVTLPRIQESCLETLKHIPLSNDPGFDITLEAQAVKEYLQECVRLCWLMVVQDPPVYLYCNRWESSQPGPLLDHTREQRKTHNSGHEDGNALHNEHQGPIGVVDDTNQENHFNGKDEGNATHNQQQEPRDGLDNTNEETHFDGKEEGNDAQNQHQRRIDCLDDTNEETYYDGQENDNAARNQHQGLIDGLDDMKSQDVKPDTCGDGDSVPETHEYGMPNRVPFNKDHYKEYTKRGAYLEFVVWPIVFLFEGGRVLQKGVAQGGD